MTLYLHLFRYVIQCSWKVSGIMESMQHSTNLNIRIDSTLKKEAEDLFKRLGLNMSSAINVFLTQSVRDQAIPFEIHEDKPNKKLLKALKEAEKIQKNPEKYKSYNNIEELMKDLNR